MRNTELNFDWEIIATANTLTSDRNPNPRAIRSSVALDDDLYFTTFSEDPGSASIWKFDNSSWSLVFCAADLDLPFNRISSGERIGNRVYFGVGKAHARDHARILVFSYFDKFLKFESIYNINIPLADNVSHVSNALGGLLVGVGSHHVNPVTVGVFVKNKKFSFLTIEDHEITQSKFQRGVYVAKKYKEYIYFGLCAKIPSSTAVLRVPIEILDRQDKEIECEVCGVFDASFIESMVVHDGKLYISLNKFGNITPNKTRISSSLWAFDSEKWNPVDFTSAPLEFRKAQNFNSSIVFDSHLLLTSGAIYGEFEYPFVRIWNVDPKNGNIRAVASNLPEGSWRNQDLGFNAARKKIIWIYQMCEFRGDLIASVTHSINGGIATIWRGKPKQRRVKEGDPPVLPVDAIGTT